MTVRALVLVLGDQLDDTSAAFDGFDATQDAILQMEVMEEASYIPQNRRRLAFFFSAMRHFSAAQTEAGRRAYYSALDDQRNSGSFSGEIRRWVDELRPRRIVCLEPGDWRVRQALDALDLDIDFREDRHFLCSHAMFADYLAGHPGLVLETFYRFMRRRLGLLMEKGGRPVGGKWNFDADNRAAFGRKGPPPIPPRKGFVPDAITREVVSLVARRFPDNPGRLDDFNLPVSRNDARVALDDFVETRLEGFGRHQDAMHGGEPFLFHAVLSGPLNLHLLSPREVVDAAIRCQGEVPLNSLEGFVRQIIGWREFVRGIYWRFMPGYAGENGLGADLPMPRFFWTGETDMRCLAEAIAHTIDHAYAHHIERLMVLGLFCLLLGVHPYEVHRWHMSMFWDAIDWVSLPNTLGMSQHADGGRIGTKPYAASGRYVDKMSNHCRSCRYDPAKALGDDACPFTTLYWDFLARHRARFAENQRMRYSYMNLDRKDVTEIAAIRRGADHLKAKLTTATFL